MIVIKKHIGKVRSLFALLVSIVFVVSSASAQPKRVRRPGKKPWVKSKRDIYEHVQAHRWRMLFLAKEIVRLGGSRYSHVDLGELQNAVFAHDEMKITTNRKMLRAFGFDRMVASHLVAMWGKPLSSENGLDESNEANVLRRMNEGDRRLEKPFSNKTLEIVHLADKIDKGADPITKREELGRVAMPASRYLSNPASKAFDPSLALIAKQIESNYEKLIPRFLSSRQFRKLLRDSKAKK